MHTNVNRNKAESDSNKEELSHLNIVVDTCSPSVWKTKAGGLGVKVKTCLVYLNSGLSYVTRPCEGGEEEVK